MGVVSTTGDKGGIRADTFGSGVKQYYAIDGKLGTV